MGRDGEGSDAQTDYAKYINQLDTKKMLLIFTAIYLLTRLFFISAIPFMQDESIYAVMIEEQAAHPTTVVTIFGYEVAWKPPLFFWFGGIFANVLRNIPIPLEAIYRLPTLLC